MPLSAKIALAAILMLFIGVAKISPAGAVVLGGLLLLVVAVGLRTQEREAEEKAAQKPTPGDPSTM